MNPVQKQEVLEDILTLLKLGRVNSETQLWDIMLIIAECDYPVLLPIQLYNLLGEIFDNLSDLTCNLEWAKPVDNTVFEVMGNWSERVIKRDPLGTNPLFGYPFVKHQMWSNINSNNGVDSSGLILDSLVPNLVVPVLSPTVTSFDTSDTSVTDLEFFTSDSDVWNDDTDVLTPTVVWSSPSSSPNPSHDTLSDPDPESGSDLSNLILEPPVEYRDIPVLDQTVTSFDISVANLDFFTSDSDVSSDGTESLAPTKVWQSPNPSPVLFSSPKLRVTEPARHRSDLDKPKLSQNRRTFSQRSPILIDAATQTDSPEQSPESCPLSETPPVFGEPRPKQSFQNRPTQKGNLLSLAHHRSIMYGLAMGTFHKAPDWLSRRISWIDPTQKRIKPTK